MPLPPRMGNGVTLCSCFVFLSVGVIGVAARHLLAIEHTFYEDVTGFVRTYARSERISPVNDEALERCTRRFTPGQCKSLVESVWTFVPDTLNCSERLGCGGAPPPSCNRFASHLRCINVCRPLIHLYRRILSAEVNETSVKLRSGDAAPRRRQHGSDFAFLGLADHKKTPRSWRSYQKVMDDDREPPIYASQEDMTAGEFIDEHVDDIDEVRAF